MHCQVPGIEYTMGKRAVQTMLEGATAIALSYSGVLYIAETDEKKIHRIRQVICSTHMTNNNFDNVLVDYIAELRCTYSILKWNTILLFWQQQVSTDGEITHLAGAPSDCDCKVLHLSVVFIKKNNHMGWISMYCKAILFLSLLLPSVCRMMPTVTATKQEMATLRMPGWTVPPLW